VAIPLLSMLLAATLLTGVACADCLSFAEARKYVGEVKCVTGVVIRIKQGEGIHFLDFRFWTSATIFDYVRSPP
jgi:hypothetical protein